MLIRSQDKEYKDDDGNVWKNIGTEYTFVSGNKATHFQQQTNEDGELLNSTSYTIIGEKAAKLQAVNRTVIVGGERLQYTVFRLPNGNLNVGRIHATK